MLTLAPLSLVRQDTVDPQNAVLHLTFTALPQVGACTPKDSNEPNLFISPTATRMSTSVSGAWVFLSLFLS